MKNIILSILATIICISWLIGAVIYIITGHIELVAISGIIILTGLLFAMFRCLFEAI